MDAWRRRFVLAAGIGLVAPTVGVARAESQLWVDAGVGLKPASRVDLELTEQVRLDQDIARFGASLTEVALRYRIKRWLRVGTGYRLEYERDNAGALVLRHRVVADAGLRLDAGPVRIGYRLRLAEQIRPSSANQLRTVLRNQLGVAYRAFSPWIPGAAVEVFHDLDDFDQFAYDKVRLTLGLGYGRKAHDAEVFFRIEQTADPMEPTYYILGASYRFWP